MKDRRDIFAQSGTSFRNMLEWMGAAYTITGSALQGHHRHRGCERAEPDMGP